MSHALAETDNFDTAVVTPDVLDTTYPATVPQGLGALANRTRWHENTLQGSSSGSSEVVLETDGGVFPVLNEGTSIILPAEGRADSFRASIRGVVSKIRGLRENLRSYAWGATQQFMNVPIEPIAEDNGSDSVPALVGTEWEPATTGHRIYWRQTTIHAGRSRLYWYIKGLPPTGTINQIACYLKGFGGHSGLPSSMPKLELYRLPVADTPTPVLVATASDTSASTSAYQALHIVNNSSFTESIAVNSNYLFVLYGEAGTNALALLEVDFCQISITTNG